MLAARAAGVGGVGVVARHVLPNVAPLFAVQLSLAMATSILAEAGLSFLGYGASAETASWGRLLSDLQKFIGVHPGASSGRAPRSPSPCSPSICSATPSATPATRASVPVPPRPQTDRGRLVSLSIDDLHVDLGGRPVLDGVTLKVGDGERLGLIGESGSGKSMTLLAVLGLLPDDATVRGSIRLDDRELVGLSDRDHARCGVPRSASSSRTRAPRSIRSAPSAARSPNRSVCTRDSVAAKRAPGRSRQRPRWVCPTRPASSTATRTSCRGGQRQRVVIATALIARPRLLLADEPTTALDVSTQAEVLDLFRRLVDERGTSLLFVTHDLAVLRGVTDHAAVLSTGRVVEQGPVRDLLTRPAHPVTRGLVAASKATTWRAT